MMRFTISTLVTAALATLASAGSIQFQNIDNNKYTITCTPSAGFAPIDPFELSGSANKTVPVPHGWEGNCYAVLDGSPNEPGMLAEFCFDGWQDLCFYDVSAIVNPNDKTGVKQIWPVEDPTNISGCPSYETTCDNCYNVWNDDIQTKSSPHCDFIVTVGTPQTTYRPRRHARDFIKALFGAHRTTADSQ